MTDYDTEAITRDAKNAPTEVGALPVMTAADFRYLRGRLGLTTAGVADRLGVAERSVQRWEHGHAPLPDGVAAQLLAWSEDTYQALNARWMR